MNSSKTKRNTFGLDSDGRCFFLRAPSRLYHKPGILDNLLNFLDWMRDTYKIPNSARLANLRGIHLAIIIGCDRQIKRVSKLLSPSSVLHVINVLTDYEASFSRGQALARVLSRS
jgi:hypothetical protein